MKIRYLVFFLTLSLLPVSAFTRTADSRREISVSTNAKDETRRWEITGPFGGDVRSLVVAPDNPSLFYLGTSDGQLFRSADGATSWERVKPGIGKRGLSIDDIEIDPRNPQVMYAAAWAVTPNMNNEMGVFKSIDGGKHWQLLNKLKGLHILSLTIAPSDSNYLLAGSKSGLYRSTDAGNDWELVDTSAYPDIKNINSVACDPQNPQVIYSGTHHLAWKSVDNGQTWKLIQKGVLDDSDIMGITVDPKDAKLVYINACSGIYRSESAGEKWTKVPGIPFSARRTYALLPHPTNPKIVYAGTSEGLWRTKDGGKRWMLLTPKTVVIRSVVVHPENPNRVIIATDDFGIQISDDLGDTFVAANNGFIHRYVLAFMSDATERGRILASVYHDANAGSVFASTDGGETWEPSAKGLGPRDVFALHQSEDDPSVIYAGTNNGVYRSTDRGANWSFVGKEVVKEEQPAKKPTTKKPTRKRTAQFINSGEATPGVRLASLPGAVGRYQTLAIQKSSAGKSAQKKPSSTTASKSKSKPAASTTTAQKKPAKKPPTPESEEPLNPWMVNITTQVDDIAEYTDAEGRRVLLAATMNGLYKTVDEAQGWEKITITGYDFNGRVFSVLTHKQTPAKIYVGTRRGLFISKDFGATWEFSEKGPTSEETVKSIAVAPNDPDNLLIGTNQFVYRSTNGGRTWLRKGGGLIAGDYTSVVINPNNPDEMLVTEFSRGGIYRSKDKGVLWERIDADLPSRQVWALMFDPFERNRVYAGSFSSGVYILTIQKGEIGSR
jgi:photosystem II stability/assembly factor-like uncharacterized protein